MNNLEEKVNEMRNGGVDERLSSILHIIGSNLARRRGRMENTILARESGVNKRLIEKLVKGEGNPTLRSLVKLAEYFNAEIADFFLDEKSRQADAEENRRIMENLIAGQFLNLKFELMKFCEEFIEKKIKN